MTVGHFLDLLEVLQAVGTVPQDVQSYGRADPSEQMNLARVAEFFFDRSSRRRLDKFSKAGAGVGETPGGQLDAEVVQRIKYFFTVAVAICGLW